MTGPGDGPLVIGSRERGTRAPRVRPAVERTPELHFQRPNGEIELARADARARKISAGDTVTVSSNGTSLKLRAKIARDLAAGTVRVALPDAGDLHPFVEVGK